MSTALYQKYRPQLFSELVGQDHIITTLVNELSGGTVSHAYLFSGPRGIGKTTIARLVARAVNCQSLKEGEPCNSCEHCSMILEQKALDIVEIDAASHTGVDHVRENIIDNARVAPSVLPWKVFIIDEVHMLSTSAFNALLKTLEEPPKQTMFILATTEIHKVPSTIVSRCEQFHFRRISFEDIVSRLQDLVKKEKIAVDQEVLEAIAKRSEGALRDAESLLGQVLVLDDKKITSELAEIVLPHSDIQEIIGLWQEIANNRTMEALERVNRLLDQGMMLTEFTKDMIEFLRKMLLYSVQQTLEPLQYLDIDKNALKTISEVADSLSVQEIARMIEVFMDAFEQEKTATIPQLPLELAIIELTGEGTPATASPPKSPPPPASGSSGPTKKQKSPPASDSEKKKEPKNAPKPSSTQASTMDEITAQWGTVLENLRRENHALHVTFQVGQVVSVKDDVLTLGFQYQFYQDRLSDPRNQNLIAGVLKEVFQKDFKLETVVGKEYSNPTANGVVENIEEPTEEEVANVWELAASSFGSQQT